MIESFKTHTHTHTKLWRGNVDLSSFFSITGSSKLVSKGMIFELRCDILYFHFTFIQNIVLCIKVNAEQKWTNKFMIKFKQRMLSVIQKYREKWKMQSSVNSEHTPIWRDLGKSFFHFPVFAYRWSIKIFKKSIKILFESEVRHIFLKYILIYLYYFEDWE